MNRTFLILAVAFSFLCNARAQFARDLWERPGTFEILSRTDYTMPEGGYTKTDVTANLERLKNLIAAVRLNPVLADIKGFNGRARIYTVTYQLQNCYGVPSRISFEFSSFFYNKEKKVVFNSIEPPEWSVYVNQPVPGWTDLFDSRKGYFTVPLRKQTILPGIDVYDKERFVIYDPSRPDYWIPVTVNEAFAAARAFAEKETNEYALALNKQFLDQEWNDIPAEYRDKPAYFGGGISRVTYVNSLGGQDSIFPRIMKVNPAYWNKALPKSAIQFITLHSILNKEYLRRELEDCRKYVDRGSGCDLQRFEYSYGLEDIKRLTTLIGK